MSATVVLVKKVTDYETDNSFTDDFRLNRENVDKILDETNEHAVEAAVQLNDILETPHEIIALTMGPDSAVEALRRAMAMGADRGIHICDDALVGSDAIQTSWVLANALGHIEDTKLIVCGDQSSDAGAGTVPAIVAEYLGIPALTSIHSLTVEPDGSLIAERATDGFTYQLTAEMPALISVTETMNEPRFPSFKGIMAAKKKEVTEWTLADIGVLPTQVGQKGAGTTVTATEERPAKSQGDIFVDNGDGAQRIMNYLVAKKLV